MNAERLLKLADFLETVDEEHFNLAKVGCGTTGCAIGWACYIPEFRDAGFKLVYYDDRFYPYPVYGGRVGFHAVEAFFDLPYYDAQQLFDTPGYRTDARTALDVSKKIRRYVDDRS